MFWTELGGLVDTVIIFSARRLIWQGRQSSCTKFSKTEIKLIKSFENSSLIECSLHTGRTHQIRLHLTSINSPIVIVWPIVHLACGYLSFWYVSRIFLFAFFWRIRCIFHDKFVTSRIPVPIPAGMGTGIRDVTNLSWKIHLILQKKANKKILETYQKERYPHAKWTIGQTITIGELIDVRCNLIWCVLPVCNEHSMREEFSNDLINLISVFENLVQELCRPCQINLLAEKIMTVSTRPPNSVQNIIVDPFQNLRFLDSIFVYLLSISLSLSLYIYIYIYIYIHIYIYVCMCIYI